MRPGKRAENEIPLRLCLPLLYPSIQSDLGDLCRERRASTFFCEWGDILFARGGRETSARGRVGCRDYQMLSWSVTDSDTCHLR